MRIQSYFKKTFSQVDLLNSAAVYTSIYSIFKYFMYREAIRLFERMHSWVPSAFSAVIIEAFTSVDAEWWYLQFLDEQVFHIYL